MEIIEEDFASGKHARVSLVRMPDQTLLVWKRPHDESKAHQMSFRKEIQRALQWRALGLSTVDVRWHDDQRSLLRTYVPGVTATERFKDREFWVGDACAKQRLALARLFRHAAHQCAYVTDMHPKNLIFDGLRWQVIDSGSIRLRDSPESTLQKYREKLIEKWSPCMTPADLPFLRRYLRALTLCVSEGGPGGRLASGVLG